MMGTIRSLFEQGIQSEMTRFNATTDVQIVNANDNLRHLSTHDFGYGGQFLHVVPEYDLISVFNGWTLHERPELFSWTALQDLILPAVSPTDDNHR